MGKSKWALNDGLTLSINQFLSDWKEIPEKIKKEWIKSFIIGFILMSVLVLLLVYLTQRFTAINGTDTELNLLKKFISFFPPFFGTAEFLSTPGNAVFIVPVSIIACLTAIWFNKPLRALSILASVYCIKLYVLIGWSVWDRARPQIVREGLFNPPLHSFPSGHVALVISVYGLLIYFWINKSNKLSEKITAAILYLILVLLVAISRLGMGMHWISDVLAGTIIGSTWLSYIIFILRKAEKNL